MNARDELAELLDRVYYDYELGYLPDDENLEYVQADAVLLSGWRKMPSRRKLIDTYQVVWAEWQTAEAPASTGYATFRDHLADAILALMDGGSE